MVSRVKYSKRIKTAPTHASVVCVNTGIGGLRKGTTRRLTGKKVILSKALWHATGTTRHKRNRGRPLHPSLSQAVSTLFVDELRKSSSLKSKSSHKSFCHHQPRPIDQNNKCYAGTLEALQGAVTTEQPSLRMHCSLTGMRKGLEKNELVRYGIDIVDFPEASYYAQLLSLYSEEVKTNVYADLHTVITESLGTMEWANAT
ncbi:hypothetical protein DPMN_020768 [Dreissena polymorpha]|uniref:Uncharacterized protein n=1 Tax=Dreissena polymorpha TaxID=45954 RepID=A0A9D4NLL8_DREPO|nr:hypothetical protein DPMN_020768 [Dreissena polymorpha]